MLTKRIFATVLAATMLCSISTVAAEKNLTEMSIEELLALKTSINEELSARTAGESNEIGNGIYVVGKDIKEGTFKFSMYPEEQPVIAFKLYENEEQYDLSNSLMYELLHGKEPAYLSLEEGNVLEILGSGTLEEVKQSWAPDNTEAESETAEN